MGDTLTPAAVPEADPHFQQYLIRPLQAVEGSVLTDVHYWLLKYDLDTFIPDKPNQTGIEVISLTFDTALLCIHWNSRGVLRGHDNYHHIELSNRPVGTDDVFSPNCDHIREVLISAPPWHAVMAQPLVGAEIYGYVSSPQAIRLIFESAAIMISTGSAGPLERPLLLGDGDDLLVFDDASWRGHHLCLPEKGWHRLLSFSATDERFR